MLITTINTNTQTIQESIKIGVKNPVCGKTLLAKTFAKCANDSDWMTKDLKIHFCLGLLNGILNSHFCDFKYTLLSKKLENKTIYFGIRLLKRYPDHGIQVLVELVLKELINHQGYTNHDLLIFYNELFVLFFPETSAYEQASPLNLQQSNNIQLDNGDYHPAYYNDLALQPA